MSVVYLDTSALLKHYVAETGSPWIDALITRPDTTAVLSCHPEGLAVENPNQHS
jgi:hypothetical protein